MEHQVLQVLMVLQVLQEHQAHQEQVELVVLQEPQVLMGYQRVKYIFSMKV
jgi:hypothetical protein